MADPVAPGVWWLHHTRGSNVYLLEADDGQLALVDTGFASNAGAILQEVAAIAGDRPLACILLTHSHADHSGSARDLRQRTGAKVVAGAADCRASGEGQWVMRAGPGRSHVARFVSRRLFRRDSAPLAVDVALDGEQEVLPGIAAIPVPGHTPGSYCYISRRAGAAFVGDLAISHAGRLSRPMAFSNADSGLYERSLAAFAQRAPGVGCPGHGQPLAEGFAGALQALAVRPRRPASLRGWGGRAGRMRSFFRHLYRRRPARPQ